MMSPSSPSYVLAFRDGISLVERDGAVAIESPSGAVPLRRLSPGLAAALRLLATGGATEEDMAAAAEASEGPDSQPRLFYYLERFKGLGFLTFSAARAGARLATLAPAPGEGPRSEALTPGVPDLGARYVLSRFACIRRDGERVVVESPLSRARVLLHDPRALAFCGALAAPRSVAEIEGAEPEARALLGLLLACRAVLTEREAEETPALAMWSFHDLLFHARSRRGRNVEPLGATFRFARQIEPLPAVKPPVSGARIELYRPDIEALKAEDAPLARVLEERRSIRAYGERPMHVRQLGELLHRTARVRGLGASSGSPSYPTSSRPYPGAGACYELELYLAVRACEGLAEGLYHYEPEDHALTLLSGRAPAVDALLAGARGALAAPEPPQVLLVLAARFGRLMWKYESMAYAAILKDVGVLFQTVYLVATAMKLAPCALGAGDSDLFAAAAGLDYLTETSVGEMALGSRAP
jgi:SagB-type dehydrogenase family enzyme